MKYKLDLYQANGLLKTEIPRGLFHDMSVRYGDVLRAIPSGRWLEFQEIVSYYRILEKRLRYEHNRTDDILQAALTELIDAGIVKTKQTVVEVISEIEEFSIPSPVKRRNKEKSQVLDINVIDSESEKVPLDSNISSE